MATIRGKMGHLDREVSNTNFGSVMLIPQSGRSIPVLFFALIGLSNARILLPLCGISMTAWGFPLRMTNGAYEHTHGKDLLQIVTLVFNGRHPAIDSEGRIWRSW